MNIASIVLLIYLFVILLKYKDKYYLYEKIILLYCIFDNFINVGYFIKFSSMQVDYSQMILILAVISGILIFHKKIKVRKSLVINILFLLFSCICGLVMLKIFPVDFRVMPVNGSWDLQFHGINQKEFPTLGIYNLYKFVMLFFFVLFVIFFNTFASYRSIERLIHNFIKFGKFNIWYCYFELFYKSIFKNNLISNIVVAIFGSSGVSQVEQVLTRGQFTVLQGFTKEPGHLAYAIFIFLILLLLSDNEKNTTKIGYYISSCIILYFSSSFAGFGFIIVTFFIFLLGIKNNKVRIPAVVLILGLLVILIPKINITYYITRFNSLITQSNFIGSEGVRLNSIFQTYNAFFSRPFFGIGIGSTNCHGFFPAILANIGIVGTFIWLMIEFYGIIPSFKNIVLILGLILLFNITGDIGDMYSGSLLLVALVLRGEKSTYEHSG